MIDSELIQTIRNGFINGKSIRRNLDKNSKIVIDQQLPYLCVYRIQGKPEAHIISLLKTQGAYLIADADLDLKELLSCLVEAALDTFKYYMVFEIWSNEVMENNKTFRILYPKGKVPATVEALEKGIEELTDIMPGIKAKLEDSSHRHPEEMDALMNVEDLQTSGVLLIGIEIPSIFGEKKGNLFYPLFFRKFRQRFADILKLAAFEFIRLQSDNKFEHYLMLGKSRLDNLVRSADRRLAEISEKLNFILSVTPVNSIEALERFRESNYSKKPNFHYRLISVDPEVEKRKLFAIPIEDIEHPTLAFLLRDKRMEIEKQLLMLEERDTKKFFHSSQSLYGDVDKNVKQAAIELLNDENPNEQPEHEVVNATDFALAAEQELDVFRKKFPQISLQVRVKPNVSGLIVSGPELSIGKDLSISSLRLQALLQHEVGTHMLTYCNGHSQPLHLMHAGFAGYEQMQEGMAVLAEYLVGGLNINRLKLLAARVLAVDSVIAGADFIETFHMLYHDYGFHDKTAFTISMRVHRGGGFTKDSIYLKGLLEVIQYIKDGGDLNLLYAGKFALEHVPFVDELTKLGILEKPLLPAFLSEKDAKARIKELKNGIELKELIA